MQRAIASIVITSVLASCTVGETPDLSTSTANIEELTPLFIESTLTETTALEEWQIITEDSYPWLPDADAFASDARSVMCRARPLLASIDPSQLPDDLECFELVSFAEPRVLTTRKLLLRFITNTWSKFVKTVDEGAATALKKILTNPGLKKEAADSLTAAVKANPDSAVKALKSWLGGWVRNNPRKIVLGVLAIAIVSGALPYVVGEISDAIKFHVWGLETDAQKIKKLEQRVEGLEKQLSERKQECAAITDADEAYVSTCALEEDLLYNELLLYVTALQQSIKRFEAAEAEIEAELDALEAALAGSGIADVQPDPAN